jgi:hypothetical protein
MRRAEEDQSAMAGSTDFLDSLKSRPALVSGGGFGAFVIADLIGHVEPRIALSILAIGALITIARSIVSIVKIRTNRSPMARMTEALAKLAKQDPKLAASLFLQLQAGDRAEGLQHSELSEMLRRALVAELEEEPPATSPISLVGQGSVGREAGDNAAPPMTSGPQPAIQADTAAS